MKMIQVKPWEEPVPQPEPPKRSCRLMVEVGGQQEDTSLTRVFVTRPATLDDIAKALGLTGEELRAKLSHVCPGQVWVQGMQAAQQLGGLGGLGGPIR